MLIKHLIIKLEKFKCMVNFAPQFSLVKSFWEVSVDYIHLFTVAMNIIDILAETSEIDDGCTFTHQSVLICKNHILVESYNRSYWRII